MRRNTPGRIHGLVAGVSGLIHAEGPWQPSADVYRTRDGWLVKFELAGVRPAEIDLRLRGARLHLRGLRRDIVCHETEHSHSMEISYNQFERSIEFPEPLEAYTTETQYQDGMLLIWLRKKA